MNRDKMIFLLLFFLILTVGGTVNSSFAERNAQTPLVEEDSVYRLHLLFAGDLMGHTPVHTAALQEDGSYDYAHCFTYVQEYIRSADLAIVNLEVTLAGPPYTGYPQFSSPLSFAAAARDAGFDIMTTANNHCMDRGKAGLEATLSALDSLGIPHLGTYRDTQQRMEEHPMLVERNGIRIALLCYTYGTNGIPVHAPNVVNDFDTIMMLRDLQVARAAAADFVIVLIHWGIEYQLKANAQQEQLARWLMNNGCDAVIGGHPHVVQNFTADVNPDNERYPELVVYSMGNLISNQRNLHCDGGIMVSLDLEKRKEETVVTDYRFFPYWVNKTTEDSRLRYYIIPSADAVEFPDYYGLSETARKALQLFDSNTRLRLQPEGAEGTEGTEGTDRPDYFPETRFYRNGMVIPQ